MQAYDGITSITPDDNNDLSPWVQGISCNVAGNITVTDARGKKSTIGIIAGFIYPVRIKRVWSTGTTATGLHGYVLQ